MFRNSFNFTILVQISEDTIRIVYEMRPCAGILSVDLPDSIRIVSGEHCLKRLKLSRYGPSEGRTELGAPYCGDLIPISQDDLESLLLPEHYFTGSVTSLKLQDPSTPTDVSEHIMRLSACLAEPSIVNLTRSRVVREYSPYTIQKFIYIHHLSLKKIHLGIVYSRRASILDFSSFPCLQELRMSAYGVLFLKEKPLQALKNLAVPNLRSLLLSFCHED